MARRTPGLLATAENWPTPMAGTPAQNGNNAAGNNDFSRKAEELAKGLWTTPQAHDVTMRGSGQKPSSKAGNACLARDADNWTTPSATDGERGGTGITPNMSGSSLTQKVANWPTPSAMQDTKGDADLGAIERREELGKQIGVAHRARQFPHPAPATVLRGIPSSEWRQTSRRLFRSVTSRVALVSLRRWLRRGNWRKRRLNPLFVEWLMGWPPGHAFCDCSATEFTRWQQDMRGALSALPTASAGWIWKVPDEPQETEEQMTLF